MNPKKDYTDIHRAFQKEARKKTICSVRQNQAVVNNEDFVFNVICGSCVSVVLCGIDQERKIWFGINHLFKSRNENDDLSLKHIAELYNNLQDNGVKDIHCLGVFGAAYKEGSIVKEVATKNLVTILEALSLYNLTIEIFQTGYSQSLSILKSDTFNSFMIKQYNINDKELKITEIPVEKVMSFI